jgi:hypothetical protein
MTLRRAQVPGPPTRRVEWWLACMVRFRLWNMTQFWNRKGLPYNEFSADGEQLVNCVSALQSMERS